MNLRELKASIDKAESDGATDETVVTHGYVSHIEAGRRVPSLEVLESIADACAMRLVDLVTIAECRRTR